MADNDNKDISKIDNTPLKQRIAVLQAVKNQGNLESVIEELRKARIILPAKLGPDKKAMPLLIIEKDGKKYHPLYTDIDAIKTDPKPECLVSVPFSVVEKAIQKLNLSGVIINPDTSKVKISMVVRTERDIETES